MRHCVVPRHAQEFKVLSAQFGKFEQQSVMAAMAAWSAKTASDVYLLGEPRGLIRWGGFDDGVV